MKPDWRGLLIGVLLAALVFLLGWDTMDRGPPLGTMPPPQGEQEAGRSVYNARCYFCHGYAGDAKTLAATFLAPPPRDFVAATEASLPLERIVAAVRDGRRGTAMQPYRGVLSEAEINAVAAFVARRFVRDKAPNTAYHTAANGWPDHQRFAAAFPFARGEMAIGADPQSLSADLQQGRRLFLSSCVSCHDRAHVQEDGPAWSARPVSYPRMGFVPGAAPPPAVDALSGASVYARHDVPLRIEGLTALQRRGEALFLANCAFCHGADGSGKNWIGRFIEPKARDLTSLTRRQMPEARLQRVIRDGLAGTSMPAWRSVLSPAEIKAAAAYVRRAFLHDEPIGAVAQR
jgi:cytochrome c oxidase cbb3-type subunit III